MLKKLITYKDFDGVTQNEEFYFNISAPELVTLELEYQEVGGFTEYLQDVMKRNDRKTMVELLKKVMELSFGRRSGDGKRFQKDPEFWKEFTETPAYEVFFLDVMTDADKNAQFFNGLFTQELIARAKALQTAEETGELALPEAETPLVDKDIDEITRDEIDLMTDEEIGLLMAKNKGNIPKQLLVWIGQRS